MPGPATTTGAPVAGGRVNTQGQQTPTPIVPFTRASMEHAEPFVDTNVTISAAGAAVAGGPIDIPAYGYIRNVVLFVAATGGTGAAAVYKEDAPWSIIQDFSILDVNGAPIVILTGYDCYLAHKWGGYSFNSNPVAAPFYVTPATTGNFSFCLRIPVEIGRRDALGSLPNSNASSTYKVRINQAASTAVYSTNPTTFPTVRWRCFLEAWALPPATGPGGVTNAVKPAAEGTTQFWTETTTSIPGAGLQRVRLPRVGNLVRNLIFVFRDGTGSRANGDGTFPTDWTVEWDSHQIFNTSKDLFKQWEYERTAYPIDNGVFVMDLTHDFDGSLGDENRDLWIPTTQSTRLELVGSFTGSGSLTIITNDVAPMGNPFID